MKTPLPQALTPFSSNLKPDEEILFHKVISRFLRAGDFWLLTNQRLLIVGTKGFEKKPLFEPGEYSIFHETGESQFSGNVHLLTNQRLILLDVGAKDYLLRSIPLKAISGVDISLIKEGWINTLIYGVQINIAGADEPVMIKHGGITTGQVNEKALTPIECQQVNERFPRKICEAAGLKFATPHMSAGAGGVPVITFYSKSDLVWPQRCSACYQNAPDLLFDSYTPENPWLAAGYHLGFGLIPQFIYQIPYCPDCYKDRLVFEPKNRAVKTGSAQSNGARVELFFQNQQYAQMFVEVNSL